METRQTAVDFLIEILWAPCRGIPTDIAEQAKAIEKKQMINFALHLHNVDMSKTGTDILKDEAEQYYQETYGIGH